MKTSSLATAPVQPAIATAPPKPWLLADIGGTNARFGWLVDDAAGVGHVATLRAADHTGPTQAAQSYLAQLAQTLGSAYEPPRAGAFAVATPVADDHIAFTNSGWEFSCEATRSDLALDTLLVLNDFEALALSLPRLNNAQLRPVGAPAVGRAPCDDTLAVLGPGTGLGVAGLVPTLHGWVAIAGEGGHATLAAADDFESELLARVRREHAHVSAERLLSGIGLPVLHAAVASVIGQAAPAAGLSTKEIVARGLAGGDLACSRTIDTFCALLGGFAGNVALVLGARGGVYIGGGIVPRLGERFFSSQFRDRFEAKGRFRTYLQTVPTALITDTLAALTGTALALEQHGR